VDGKEISHVTLTRSSLVVAFRCAARAFFVAMENAFLPAIQSAPTGSPARLAVNASIGSPLRFGVRARHLCGTHHLCATHHLAVRLPRRISMRAITKRESISTMA
jgi:hypothetical protein